MTTAAYTEQRLIDAARAVVREARAGRRTGEAIDRMSTVLDALDQEPYCDCGCGQRRRAKVPPIVAAT